MDSGKTTISGTGCALADYLYTGISFGSEGFVKYLSKRIGDGGLSPGKLVFTEELEEFASLPIQEILEDIIGNRKPDAFNVGGPSLVCLIHASQLLDSRDYEIKFFGMSGSDETRHKILNIVRPTPLNIRNYITTDQKLTPYTNVFSDPDHDDGHGERTFINNIGAAWDYAPEYLTDEFFESDIVCFGGTALVPQIHDNLTSLLAKAREKGCITVVNTVFDFRNEKRYPGKPWPLVSETENYGLIDLLIMDSIEAIRISGRETMDEAASFFEAAGVGSFIITNGAKDLVGWSQGGLFEKTGMLQLPVSDMVIRNLAANARPKGDTTGCGDNFAGGVIASMAMQIKSRSRGELQLTEALSWGIASGGFCCFTVGGTYQEEKQGEKRTQIEILLKDYRRQIGN